MRETIPKILLKYGAFAEDVIIPISSQVKLINCID